MSSYSALKETLAASPRTWLITGVAGFIGSNLLETLLRLGQKVVGLDNFATGFDRNLLDVEALVGPEAWSRFTFIQGDMREAAVCATACQGVDVVLHQAALGSVPRSIVDPLTTNECNVTGFVNLLTGANDAGVKRFVYASSSSVYGDSPDLPKVEEVTGAPLSPYAVTKCVNELYADVFARTYGMECAGLRYFNVYGPRQDPEGAYAAVMPKWFAGLLNDQDLFINGDGETSRDFCYVDNAVQANLLAGATDNPEAVNQVYNVACGERTTLNELMARIRDIVARTHPQAADKTPEYRDFRPGDVRHSLASIDKAQKLLGYEPEYMLDTGLEKATSWYLDFLSE